MRVKREYLTSEPPQPRVIEKVVEKVLPPRTIETVIMDPLISKRLAQIEKVVARLLELETAPEPEDPALLDISDRLDALQEKIERIAKTPPPPPPPPPPKPTYQFDVVRNSSGAIEKVVAKPLKGEPTIYRGR